MFGKSNWKIVLTVAAILAMMTGQPCVAQTTCTYPDVAGGGVYNQPGAYRHYTVTVVNLTTFELVAQNTDVTATAASCGYTCGYGTYPFQNFMNPIKVPANRSSIWAGPLNNWDAGKARYYNPVLYGRIPWILRDSAGTIRAQFDVIFQYQSNGTWMWLSGTGWNGWCAPFTASASCGGIYPTKWMHRWGDPDFTPSNTNSLNMQNIMTLGNTKFAVALYSTENHHVVLVVREVQGDDYYGFTLDWVDNSSGVPGDCNK